METERYLDEFEHQVDRMWSTLIDFLQKSTPSVIAAIEEGNSGSDEIHLLFEAQSVFQAAKERTDKALRLWIEFEFHPGNISPRAAEVLKTYRVVDAALESRSSDVPVNVGIAGAHASEKDASERAIDDLVGSVFNVRFTGASIKSRAGGGSGQLSRHHGRLAASKLFRDVFSRIDTYRGKGQAYYATAVRKEQKRFTRDFEIEDRNFLGLRPKESKDLTKEDRDLIRAANREAADTDDRTTAAAISISENPEEIALAQEEESSMELFLDRKSPELPDDQKALFECWRAGESPTDAREHLGLPKSTETALRNRLRRWAHEWTAQQAS
jgi:hypothetical protein